MKFQVTTPINDDRPVYITGSFNKWDPRSHDFRLKEIIPNSFEIEISDDLLPEIVEYKFTKGGWENVELDENGNITPNRKASISQKTVSDIVTNWRLNWGPFKEEFFPIIEVVDDDFYIPQLDRYRKVWALLPYNYYETDTSYPVLYLQDAQNLFNNGSEFGNWEIDRKLSVLTEYGRGDIIVIAVDHGDSNRIKEYIFDNDNIASGSEGKKYIRFITDTLKPYIDKTYRTKKDRENTGIGGSSLGALISIYSGFLYPEVYSKLLVFSPSLWIEPDNNFPMMRFRHPFETKIYIYGGEQEGAKMVNRIHEFEDHLKKWEAQKLFDFEVKTSINPNGTHNEFYWSQEFPRAMEWLYYDNPENPLDVSPQQNSGSMQNQ